MKKFQHFSLILITLFAVVFTSCEDEPLVGEFITEEPGGEPGSFVATIDGEAFTASEVTAQINMGALILTGSNGSRAISFIVANKSECTFDLTSFSSSATVADSSGNGFSTSGLGGGDSASGQLEITSYNTEALTVSGTFEFVAVELTPGGTGTETITVTEGSFSSIPFTVLSGDVEPSECVPPGTGDGDPDPDPDPTPAILFAKADDVDFVPTDVVVSQYLAGMTPMIQILAIDEFGAALRLDVPETLVLGTFDLFNGISDGSNLIGYYNPNTGGEVLSSNPGTITITEFSSLTGKLVANFEFTAQDPLGEDPTVVQITEGNLDVSFVATPGNVSFAFEAEVDGDVFTAEAATAVTDVFNGVSIITISANMGDQIIEIDFPIAATTEGMYGMSPALVTGNEIVGTYRPILGSGDLYTSDPGTLTITAYDETSNIIEGTFSFTAKDPMATDPTVYEVTNGSFMLLIQ